MDAVVSKSTLLGPVNAEPWAVAISLSRQLLESGPMFIDGVPGMNLIRVAIQVISHSTTSTHEHAHRP